MQKTKISVTSKDHERARRAAQAYAYAQRRVGQAPIKQLAWLAELANSSEDQLKAALQTSDPPILFYEIVNFTAGAGGAWDKSILSVRPEDLLESLMHAFGVVKHGLESLADTGRCDWEVSGSTTRYFTMPEDRSEGGAAIPGELIVDYEFDEAAGAFTSKAGDVVAAEGGRIARCDAPDCKKLFVRRKRGLSCSNRCALRKRQAKFRDDLKAREKETISKPVQSKSNRED